LAPILGLVGGWSGFHSHGIKQEPVVPAQARTK
jgi:hypothetical protein